MCFQFTSYGIDELARCGEALARLLRRPAGATLPDPREARAVELAWLDATAAPGALSIAGPVLRDLGIVPLALDLAHIDLDDGRLLLAVAHEPPAPSEQHGYVYLLARAAALAATKSRSKLLVSAFRGGALRRVLVECVLELRKQLEDGAPWLWIEAPGPGADAHFTLLERP